MTEKVHGFKVFQPDWTCSPSGGFKQYSCPGRFQQDGDLDMCGNGMHFCLNLADCFNYYSFNPDNKVAEVIAHGEVIQGDDKCCTNDLEVVREISWQEVLTLVNTGKACTGRCNTGDWNTGDCNTGSRNTGDWNTGDWNTGSRNTGDCNTGDCNTGDWNLSSFNTGCFMTEEQPIMMFNKPSDWTFRKWVESDARWLLNHIPKNVTTWVYACDMTDQEKADHPEHKTTGGYLKTLDEADAAQTWWDGLDQCKRDIILDLPNFDADIFFKCTGINVKGEDNA
nr:MAG TPA: pentapeptide repeat protein [Caudoviricetes sp.]